MLCMLYAVLMHVIVGLGNPGKEYEATRHNTGRMLVARFAETANFPEFRKNKKANAEEAEANVAGEKTVLVLPDTFMNKSGNAVARYVKSVKAAKNLVVVHDDIDLPFGTVRIAFGRGDGGHNGIKSVSRALKTRDFIRVRVGISPKSAKGAAKKPVGEAKVLKFILGKLTPTERKALAGGTAARASDILTTIIEDGHEAAMNRFNGSS